MTVLPAGIETSSESKGTPGGDQLLAFDQAFETPPVKTFVTASARPTRINAMSEPALRRRPSHQKPLHIPEEPLCRDPYQNAPPAKGNSLRRIRCYAFLKAAGHNATNRPPSACSTPHSLA